MKLKDDTKKVIEAGKQLGFEMEPDLNGSGHVVFVGHGQRLTFSYTSSDWRGHKNMISRMERISGQKIHRHNHHRSRKHDKTERYTDTYTPETQRQWSERIELLLDEHRGLVDEFKGIAVAGQKATRTDIMRALEIVRRLNQLEEVFIELRQPVPQFDPQNPFS